MERLLLIETSSALCSVALAEDGVITASRLSEVPRDHAARTAPFVQEVLEERGLRVKDCAAVCVGRGPGSYTGLRVGVSTAKGLCFGAGIPLLSVSTSEILFRQALEERLLPEGCRTVITMVDARRMEVYAARYTPEGELLSPDAPVVVTADSFREDLERGPVLFIGDGAEKCREFLRGGHFAARFPRAEAMLKPALDAFRAGHFEDVAYFEPDYLKEFQATVSHKNLFLHPDKNSEK